MKTNWTETIWTTNNCEKLISKDIDNTVYEFLKTEFAEIGCEVKAINGTDDHVHCLFNINAKRSLDEIIKMVKGATSQKINQEGFIKTKFAWEKGYEAEGIGKSELKEKIQEILNQKSIHADQSITVADEIYKMHESENE
jgi:REP element-mobilizing transposase RayT